MVRDDGVIKVLDFGIARRAAGDTDPNASTEAPALPTLTALGVKLGTPVYMAPEQIRGAELDGRADQFAWGVLAFELLTGRLPWRGAGDMLAVVASILTDEADSAPLDAAAVPPAVSAVVLRALSKRPDDRFASMDDLLRALDAAGRGEAPAAPAPAAATSAPPAQAPGAKGSEAPRGGETAAQRFSTEEVRDVLAQAIERQAAADGGDARAPRGDARIGFDDLLAAAEEVGVAPRRCARRAARFARAGATTWSGSRARRPPPSAPRGSGASAAISTGTSASTSSSTRRLLTLGLACSASWFWVGDHPAGLGDRPRHPRAGRVHRARGRLGRGGRADAVVARAASPQARGGHGEGDRRRTGALRRPRASASARPRRGTGGGKLRVETDTARSTAEQAERAEEEAAVAVSKPQRRRR